MQVDKRYHNIRGGWENSFEKSISNLTLRRPNFKAKTVKVGSDHSKNLTSVFYGAKHEKLTLKTLYIYIKLYKINFFLLIFVA